MATKETVEIAVGMKTVLQGSFLGVLVNEVLGKLSRT